MVAQLYPQAPGTHFGRLLRPAWAAMGLIFSPVTTRKAQLCIYIYIYIYIYLQSGEMRWGVNQMFANMSAHIIRYSLETAACT